MYVQRGAQPVFLSHLGFSNWVHRGLQASVCIQRKVGSRRQQIARDSEQRGRRALIDGRIDTRRPVLDLQVVENSGKHTPTAAAFCQIRRGDFSYAIPRRLQLPVKSLAL